VAAVRTALDRLGAGNSAFTFDRYRQLRQEEHGNLYYSPTRHPHTGPVTNRPLRLSYLLNV
jgi:hypothetical protein